MKNQTEGTTLLSGIAQRVMKILKLDDASRVDSFVKSQIQKEFKEEIVDREHNLKTLNLGHKRTVDKSEETIAELTESVDAAWLNITVDNVANLAAQKAYKVIYLRGIENAEDALEEAIEVLEKVEKSHKIQVERIENEISEYRRKLTKSESFQ